MSYNELDPPPSNHPVVLGVVVVQVQLQSGGLNKDLREMLPIIVYRESFSLGDPLPTCGVHRLSDGGKRQQYCHQAYMDPRKMNSGTTKQRISYKKIIL